jgi:hypothetical protein
MNINLLERARSCYDGSAALRQRRERFKKFTFGDQWSDPVAGPGGKTVTEGEKASMGGKVPLTNNMIRGLVKTMVGYFRRDLQQRESKPTEVEQRNSLDELDARLLEEFLISGCAIQRVVSEHRPGGSGLWVDNVNPARFFASRFTDPRALDVELVGMLHDWSVAETVARFSGGSRQRAGELRRLCESYATEEPLFPADSEKWSFSTAASGRCRVIEVWTLEATEQYRCTDAMNSASYIVAAERVQEIERRNRQRQRRKLPAVSLRYEFTTAWHGRWLTPGGLELGHVVAERHPFAMKFYPLIDGEVHSFVEDVIDQQKYVNRLITMSDNIMSASAKGVLLFPEDQLSDYTTWQDVREAWASYDGILPYRPMPDAEGPHQVVTNAGNSGVHDLLQIELKLFETVSGVSGALQGRTDGKQSAELYEAQLRSSTAAMEDVFATFNDFRRGRNRMLVN